MATIETAKNLSAVSSIWETLKQTNQSLISTLDEVMKIQEDGVETCRAEVELYSSKMILKKCWSFLQADSTDTFVSYMKKNGETAFSVVSRFFTSCLTLISGVLPFHSFFGIP